MWSADLSVYTRGSIRPSNAAGYPVILSVVFAAVFCFGPASTSLAEGSANAYLPTNVADIADIKSDAENTLGNNSRNHSESKGKSKSKSKSNAEDPSPAILFEYLDANTLDVEWHSPTPSSPGSDSAFPGGVFRVPLGHFPSTLRRFGPDTPSSLTPILNHLQLSLAGWHSSINKLEPLLAQSWNWNQEKRRLCVQLNPSARWSDGWPVSSGDIAFSLRFLTAPATQADFHARSIFASILAFQEYSASRFCLMLHPDIDYRQVMGLRPLAAHFYQADYGWPVGFDRLAEPTTGPYRIDNIEWNKSISLRKTAYWWGSDLPFFKNRFNPSRVVLSYSSNGRQYYRDLKAGQYDALPLLGSDKENQALMEKLCERFPINRYRFQGTESQFEWLVHNPLFRHHKEATASSNPGSIDQSHSDTSPAASDPSRVYSCHTPNLNQAEQEDWLKKLSTKFDISGNSNEHQVSSIELIKEPCIRIQERLSSGNFDYLWLRIQADSHTQAINYLRGISESSATYRFQTVKMPAADQEYAVWPWIRLPEESIATKNPLDPFDPIGGGMFWIDPLVKHKTFSKSYRSRPAPGKIYGYEANPPQGSQ